VSLKICEAELRRAFIKFSRIAWKDNNSLQWTPRAGHFYIEKSMRGH
jgi:hypothetical protein